MSPYAAIVETFPASVAVERRCDRLGDVVTFRIAGEARLSVAAEIERIAELSHERAWVRFLGPIRWADVWVAWGEMREHRHG